MSFPDHQWALILGGSSGFGLATAKKLAAHGLNIAIVHRDRRGVMARVDEEFDRIRDSGVRLLTFNKDALAEAPRKEVIATLKEEMGAKGRIRLLLHSIALGNLKPLAPQKPDTARVNALETMATGLDVDVGKLDDTIKGAFKQGLDPLHTLAGPVDYGTLCLEDEDFAVTIYSMGASLWSWVRAVLDVPLFADDARILGLTSEGNEIAWRGYGAVSAAKAVMESISRSMALELAPYGLRSNIIQAGITETPASALIPGIDRLKAGAKLRNPFGRLTRPEDIADFIYLLCRDEAAWVNGTVIRVDGGEHISGGTQ